MKTKYLASALVGAAMIATPATKVSADAGDFIAGAIIGGVIGSQVQKNKRRTTYRSTRPRLPVTQEGRLIQTSLNYFGFNAGAVDGQLGRRSRAAISQYQAHMGFPATGQLSPYERDFLFSSYERAQAGGSLTLQQIASNPMGSRGLLHIYRDQAAGIRTASVPAVPNTVVVPAPSTTVVTVAPAAPAPAPTTEVAAEPEADTGSALPNFGGSTQSVSLASHCNGVSLLTSSNGGFTTVSSMTNPEFALSEQFCLARTYAIATGEQLVNDLNNVTPAQVSEQCAAFGPAMQQQLVAAASQPMDAVIQSTSEFVVGTGMPPANLKSTAQVCLSSGYRTDDMEVALASSLILVSLGAAPYAELVGHHLLHGFGVAKRGDLAQPWFNSAIGAIEAGATPAFNPGQPERTSLVKAAATSLASGTSGTTPVAPQAAATLPSFGSSD